MMSSALAESIVTDAIHRALASGLGLIPPSREPGALSHVPFSLSPKLIPRDVFDHAVSLAVPFNSLVAAIAQDPTWLLETLQRTAVSDPFTGRLVDQYRLLLAEGIKQPIALGIFRSDYMIDEGIEGTAVSPSASRPQLRQIELNTISSAFGGLSPRVTDLHSFLADRYSGLAVAPYELPVNTATLSMAAALRAAVDEYVKQSDDSILVDPLKQVNADKVAVAFVVQPRERNVLDQRHIEYALWANHRVRTVRVTLAELHSCAALRTSDDALVLRLSGGSCVDGNPDAVTDIEIAVVYYRCGYTPDDYPTETEWSARWMVERSRAIKCPDLALHLCGTKKVQQALAAPGIVERFVEPQVAQYLRTCFAGLWSLDPAEATPETAAAIADAKLHPQRYVVKPQREGGGNNLFGDAVAAALAGAGAGARADGIADKPGVMTDAELAGHILMERVFPRPTPAVFIRGGEAIAVRAVSELGVYSVLLLSHAGTGGSAGLGRGVLLSAPAGHLVRTKTEGTDEGGVAAGYAVLDSPALT